MRRRWSWKGGGLCQGQGVKLPCASPLYIRVEGSGFFPSKSIVALAKVGGKKSHHFLPHQLLSPLFRDLDLIPSGYDLIPSKGGSWCAFTTGVGPCPTTHVHVGHPCRWAPLRNLLEPSRYNTEKSQTFSVAKIGLPIYKSLPPDHSGTPHDVRDPEQLSINRILISLQL